MTLARCFARQIAHRGLHACGGVGPVENSLGAASAAIAGGFAIECDIQLSRDGEAMVFHDYTLDRLTKARGWLADTTSEALGTQRLGGTTDTIPTLSAFLAHVAARVPLVIEIKRGDDGDFRLADRALALLASYAGDVVLESFDPGIVLHCLGEDGGRTAPCPVGLVGPWDEAAPAPETMREALRRSDFLSWSVGHLREATVLAAGRPLSTWTVRTGEQATAAVREGAQIVFEGFTPTRFLNPGVED